MNTIIEALKTVIKLNKLLVKSRYNKQPKSFHFPVSLPADLKENRIPCLHANYCKRGTKYAKAYKLKYIGITLAK